MTIEVKKEHHRREQGFTGEFVILTEDALPCGHAQQFSVRKVSDGKKVKEHSCQNCRKVYDIVLS